jgi:DNA-binding response OmpR family regulator
VNHSTPDSPTGSAADPDFAPLVSSRAGVAVEPPSAHDLKADADAEGTASPESSAAGETATPAGPEAGSATEPGRSSALRAVSDVHILILDDDPIICQLMAAALAGQDHYINAVSDPAQMEGHIKSRKYHVIILDFVIPGLNPEQIFNWVHQYQTDAGIIVVTGNPSIDSALTCLRARTYDYITKPFQIEQLREVVRNCLEAKGLLRLSENALREVLGAAIRERRKGLGMTLSELAKRTSLSLGYLSQIELGKNSASIETLYRISLGLRTKLTELFSGI